MKMKNKRSKNAKPWFEIKAMGTSAEVFIYDEIGGGMFGGVGAKEFVNELNTLKGVENIKVRINSPGGSVFEGVTIYNALLQHPAHIETQIDGLAASIASVIALAGDTVTMADNALFMIHDPWSFAMGDAAEMRKTADLLDKIKGTLVTTYVNNSVLTEAGVIDFMASETWFDAQEAMDHGFVDQLTEAMPAAASFDLSRFKNAPVTDTRHAGHNVVTNGAGISSIQAVMKLDGTVTSGTLEIKTNAGANPPLPPEDEKEEEGGMTFTPDDDSDVEMTPDAAAKAMDIARRKLQLAQM